ncbi:MAG: CobD/CbiB family protein [Burkholderia sp.]|nr:CobD/CbiB family protein [Burkholderia sp.]
MIFFSVLLAFIIEQSYSLSPRNPVSGLLQFHVKTVVKYFDKSKFKNSLFLWIIVVLPWILIISLIYFLLYKISFLFVLVWNVIVIYFTLGFGKFNCYITNIHSALKNSDINQAREILNKWTGIDTSNMPVIGVVRYTLIYTIIASHRNLFGIFFLFASPVGISGVVLYRISEYLACNSSSYLDNDSIATSFSKFSHRVFFIIDWIPVRLTSLGFAIVGNFEDAIYEWRNYAHRWSDSNIGVLLTACSGALGTKLIRDTTLFEPSNILENTLEIDNNGTLNKDNSQVDNSISYVINILQDVINLVGRSVVLWATLLLMLTIASYIS